jgi:cytochrome c peroxidase
MNRFSCPSGISLSDVRSASVARRGDRPQRGLRIGCKTILVIGLLLAVRPLFSQDRFALPEPKLPLVPFDYVTYAVADVPQHYKPGPPFGDAGAADNTPADNPITNDGATLGRVLFYDARLSVNNRISCASCHRQSLGFTDPRRLSIGVSGRPTFRHSMALNNAKFYFTGRFRWDETADTLEDQVLLPIQHPDEMGMNLIDLEVKLAATRFYPRLFENAFGDTQITNERISKALSQFVRSMVSYKSKYDLAFEVGQNGYPDFEAVFNEAELLGRELFERSEHSVGCHRCHGSTAFIGDEPRNIGLDQDTSRDQGAGDGKFKTTSLRNIAVRGRFMHDGRFGSLQEVIEFYNSGIQPHPALDPLLRENEDPDGPPLRLNLTQNEKDALVAFLDTLTDHQFLKDHRFSDPFAKSVR